MHEVIGEFRLRIQIAGINCQRALEQILGRLQSAKGKTRSLIQGLQIHVVGIDLLRSDARRGTVTAAAE